MGYDDKIEKLLREMRAIPGEATDKRILADALGKQSGYARGNNWILKIAGAAAVFTIGLLAILFVVSERQAEPMVCVKMEGSAGSMSVLGVNRVFAAGGFKAVEEELDRMERRGGGTVEKRVTIDQLISEFETNGNI
jgi:hypothetical protein